MHAATAGDGVRAIRLAAFAVAATCLALGSHVLAGGAPPAAGPTLLACGLPGAAGAMLTVRRRGAWEILAVLGAVQVAMHELFAASGTTGMLMPGSALGSGVPAPGSAGVMPTGCAAGMLAWLGLSGQSGGSPVVGGLAMLVAHGAATVVTALLLARGEQALYVLLPLLGRLLRGARRLVPHLVDVAVLGRRPRGLTVDPCVRRVGLVAVAGLGRRGPPTPVF